MSQHVIDCQCPIKRKVTEGWSTFDLYLVQNPAWRLVNPVEKHKHTCLNKNWNLIPNILVLSPNMYTNESFSGQVCRKAGGICGVHSTYASHAVSSCIHAAMHKLTNIMNAWAVVYNYTVLCCGSTLFTSKLYLNQLRIGGHMIKVHMIKVHVCCHC